MDFILVLAKSWLGGWAQRLFERNTHLAAALHAGASRWSPEQREYGEILLGLTACFVNTSTRAITLSDFYLNIGFLDPLDDYATAQRHRLSFMPEQFGGEVLILPPREKVEQTFWASLDAVDAEEVQEQRRSVGMTLTAYDFSDQRYWARLLLTVSRLKRPDFEDFGAGEWYE